ncbi:MAG TPA: DUF2723 domain-containing protein [Bacteroidales bacterium]|nr:DUF2723 domain-containing protein [Bacteroidales bacterium]HPS17605.1 DUF2723 domain-containing protein [Bacteroidales bacterium]
MKNYKLLNNTLGWVVFIVASVVYIMTSEPTASFWDCGEYISTAFKLEVGHPPGAPTFQLFGRFFSLFAFNDLTQVARMVNIMSALVSAFSILFLFWSITHIAKKIATIDGELTDGKMWAVLGSGLVGSLAYTFTDSFWFSAVEGEVYATSSFFTAIVFWCILKWEENANDRYSMKWIILIAYLVGLSIGVHLLNLLAIPAITYVIYFKKYKPSVKGFVFATGIGLLMLVMVMYVIIPHVVDLFAKTELLFVNTLGLPFNFGSLLFGLLIIALLATGILYTTKQNPKIKTYILILGSILALLVFAASSSFLSFLGRLIILGGIVAFFYYVRNNKPLINTIVLSVIFLLIGYSTFFILVIRSNAKTPLNENAPKNAIALLSYLNREQYGDWPLFYGQYYNAPLNNKEPYTDGNPVYSRDDAKGKYVISDDKKSSIPNYDDKFCTIFPRMWKEEKEDEYKEWAKVKGKTVSYTNNYGETESAKVPTFGENIYYFMRYQMGYMYWRYFMWNFAGRQNDLQGSGDPIDGNWISGINSIDKSRIGPVELLPENLENKGNARLYFLPLILGLIGLFYVFSKNYKDGIVVLIFFLMTGLAIVIYLNQGPSEPRERDYAYAGSFYAFAIWIGLGVLAIYDTITKYIKPNKIIALAVTLICLFAVPYVMAKAEWKFHDRSKRYTCLDFAANYLNSCAPNAILFTNGDNDTFPLWYVQEVEGIRTDVRVVNLSLLNTDWYIDQIKRKAYDSDPAPISMTWDQYKQGTRDVVYFVRDTTICNPGKYYELKDLLDVVLSDDPNTKKTLQSGKSIAFFPTNKFKLTIDKDAVIKSGTVSKEQTDSIVDKIEWEVKGVGVQKNNLAVLDIIAHNNWKRPIYFSITTGNDAYINLEKYFQLEGLAYRLVPLKVKTANGQTGEINSTVMYNNIMNKFKWGNMNNPEVYLDETNLRMTMNFRNNFARLAEVLVNEGKKDSAIKVLDRCMEVMPETTVPYNYFILPVAEAYYKAGANEKANKIISRLTELYAQNLEYYSAFKSGLAKTVTGKLEQSLAVMNRISYVTKNHGQDSLSKKAKDYFDKYYASYTSSPANTKVPAK